jgi:ABC-2 type transport system permease protein
VANTGVRGDGVAPVPAGGGPAVPAGGGPAGPPGGGAAEPSDGGPAGPSRRAPRKVLLTAGSLALLNLRASLQYRADFVVLVLVGAAWQLAALAFVGIVVTQFHGIRGWGVDEVLFIAGLRLLAHAFYVMVFYNLTLAGSLIRQGDLDRLFIRPLNLLLQVMLVRFPLNGAGDLAIGASIFTVAALRLHLHLSPIGIGFVLLVLVGAMLLEAGLQLVVTSLSIWLVVTEELGAWLDQSMNSFANYPLPVFPGPVRAILTFVLPLGFLAFFPATAILGKAGQAPFSPVLAFLAPVVGLAVFLLAYQLWRVAVRHYAGTGT